MIDAVRLAKLALNNGVAGALEGPSSYLMKSPPKQIVDDEAYEATEKPHRPERAAEGEGARDGVDEAPPSLSGIGAAGLLGLAALISIVAPPRGEFTDGREGPRHARRGLRRGLALPAGLALLDRSDLVPLGWPLWSAGSSASGRSLTWQAVRVRLRGRWPTRACRPRG